MSKIYQHILYDMSSLVWTGLMAGKDGENGYEIPHPEKEGKTIYVNGYEFGYENAMNSVQATLKKFNAVPSDLILVFEGANSKALRTGIFADYKNKVDNRVEETYKEFNKALELVKNVLMQLGATAVKQDGMEADDVVAYLAKTLPTKKLVVSNDGDYLKMHSKTCDVYIGGNLNENKYGLFDFQYVTVYKALVGDTSDNIKGAYGFGDSKFLDLYIQYGDDGLELLEQLILSRKLEELEEDVPTLKCLQKIIDDKEGVYTSYDLARFYIEKVNTFRKPLQWEAGMVHPNPDFTDDRFTSWYAQVKGVTTENFDKSVAHFRQQLKYTPFVALDIETSTSEESDQWMEAKSRRAPDEERAGVDVFGSELTGVGITYGDNMQYSLYFSVDHADTKNVASEQVRKVIASIPSDLKIVVHNASFELSVLYQAWADAQKDNGYEGFLPNIEDTTIMASYVDENSSRGLKSLSLNRLGYTQTTYNEVTQGRKMNELTLNEVLAYGTDDTICTSAVYNHLKLIMLLEGTYDIYQAVEVSPAYLTALAFVQGTPMSLERMLELEAADDIRYEKAWAIIRDLLISKGWEGTVYEPYTETAANIKAAYTLVTGQSLDTQVRTPSKLFALIREAGQDTLAEVLEANKNVDEYLKVYFSGEPEFNMGSTKQVGDLLYNVLGLPVRLRNAPTDTMRAAGIREGSPKTDDLAMQFALKYDIDMGVNHIIGALQDMKTVTTRRGLYYKPYKFFQHWKDGNVHAQANQCQTNTRRYSFSSPNLQQLPKKDEGLMFREIIVPHKKGAVVVSMDFSGQELRVIADDSKDQNMLDCFVGDNLRDMHSMTGAGIAAKKGMDVDYDRFMAILNNKKDELFAAIKEFRATGKKVNFTTEYGAQAKKLSETLLVTEQEAQQYIDAKLAAFPRAEAWKKELIAAAKACGYSYTLMGAVRHLGPMLLSKDRFESSKAERQAVNFRIQSSSAEMTKLAMGRLWDQKIYQKYDARFIAPIHDELVSSVVVSQLYDFICEKHAAMVAPYGNMVVPIVSSISFGPNFGVQIEVGETPDREVIEAAVKDLCDRGLLEI